MEDLGARHANLQSAHKATAAEMDALRAGLAAEQAALAAASAELEACSAQVGFGGHLIAVPFMLPRSSDCRSVLL